MRAAALAAQLPVEVLHQRALAAIRARPAGEPVAIACSGGADSVALLLVLWAHLPEWRGRWRVLHFNHKLRGRAADADAEFVREIARGLGERCVVGVWRRSPARASEADAREVRWTFFRKAMAKTGAHVIALGHQQDDVAESMLMRLTRGSGTSGLAAPRPVQRMADGSARVRPLLELSAAAIRDGMRLAHARWREDATNATDDFFRNRVRRLVLPALLAAAPQDGLVGFAAARDRLEEDDDALEAWLDEAVSVPPRNGLWNLSALQGRPRALARRAIHRWAAAAGLNESPSRRGLDHLVDAVVKGRECQLSAGPGRWVVVERGAIACVDAGHVGSRDEPWRRERLTVDRVAVGPRGERLVLRSVRMSRALLARITRGEFSPADTVFLAPGVEWGGGFDVRAWQPGDRYRPLGAPGRQKLQDLFVNRRVPRELRSLLPVVVAANDEPVWVPGLPPAAGVAVQPRSKLVVQLTYTGAVPTVHRSKTGTLHDV